MPPPLVRASTAQNNHALNAVRAVAALLVVVSHLRAMFFVDYEQASHNALSTAFYLVTGLGEEAVMIFFVLSGYWVGGGVLRQMRAGRFSWRGHAQQRLTRLWIVLIPALVLTAVVDRVGTSMRGATDVYVGNEAYHHVAPEHLHHHNGLLVALGNVFFLGDIRVPTFGTNGPLWSLSYEVVYYALFPLLLLALARSTPLRARLGWALLAGVLMLIAGPHVLLLGLVWLVGVAASAVAPRARVAMAALPRPAAGGVQVAALGGLLLALTAGKSASHAMPGRSGIPVLFGVLALASAGLLLTLTPDVSGPRLLRRGIRGLSELAEYSYSLYAIHCPLVVFAAAFMVPRIDDRWTPTPASVLVCGALLAGCLAAGYVFALGTEKQTDRLRGYVAHRRSVRSAAGGAIPA